ncbi:DUF3987 domain-containing protein [Sphingosinicella sp. YJ22]|uniref:DUF3987 domain-containing protein n=1 Tax=Sphingosinicella sp. YJ22 TaxID=1104780 RepID=UPI00140876DB|nr:DUF3987 domain-containing protein [Sphingosinicella sp. YJ22]
MHLEHFDEGQGWYVMQCALERGDDPHEALRAAQARPPRISGDSTGPRPISAVGGAKEPACGWPPGRTGNMARLIFETSYSPVPEVAIAATIALLAGVCGRAYRTHTGVDLALYMILVARSGTGKDAIHKGIPRVLKMAERPMADRFVRSVDFVSGQALQKELLREPGFLNLQGEFGKKLKQMSNPTNAPMQAFRTLMLNAYAREHLEGMFYSNAENNLLGVDWPALSFLGETTPGTFLQCLTADMMEDGFMSRFLVISYDGDKPYPNPNHGRAVQLPGDDLGHWGNLVDHALRYQWPVNTPAPLIATPNEDALERLTAFERECIANVNATEEDAERQVWNRAHLKVLKIASLLAVADHFLKPVIKIQHVAWARSLVARDIAMFEARKRAGDIGSGDDARERKLLQIMGDYLLHPPGAGHKVPEDLRVRLIIPRFYLQRRTASLPAFHNHRLGPTKALDEAMRSLADSGYVREVLRHELIERHSFHGKAYRLLRGE